MANFGEIILNKALKFRNLIGGAFTTTLAFTAPTANRTQTLQDKSGTIALLSDISAAGGGTMAARDADNFGDISGDNITIKGADNLTRVVGIQFTGATPTNQLAAFRFGDSFNEILSGIDRNFIFKSYHGNVMAGGIEESGLPVLPGITSGAYNTLFVGGPLTQNIVVIDGKTGHVGDLLQLGVNSAVLAKVTALGIIEAPGLALKNSNFTATISSSTLTANRTFTTPNTSGKIAIHPEVVVYTTPGTFAYTIPAWAEWVEFYVQNAGLGGGSGRRGAAGSARGGGGGGGGGGATRVKYRVADLPSRDISVIVGTGGNGGAAVTVNSTNGSAGTGANASQTSQITIGGVSFASASTGGPGGGGTTAGGTAGSAGVNCLLTGAAGAVGGATGGGNGGGNSLLAGAGGGSGAGIPTGNTSQTGGAGGRGTANGASTAAAPAGGANTGGNGANATAATAITGGNGGGGGGTNANGTGGNGGNGIYGGGGGGGGASLDGFNSGAGGRGGDGFVIIYLS
jgi:hypothetical protein